MVCVQKWTSYILMMNLAIYTLNVFVSTYTRFYDTEFEFKELYEIAFPVVVIYTVLISKAIYIASESMFMYYVTFRNS